MFTSAAVMVRKPISWPAITVAGSVLFSELKASLPQVMLEVKRSTAY